MKLKVSWLRAFLWCMSQTSRDWVNSRRVRTHEKNSGDAVRRLGTIIQSIFCAQSWSGASIRLTVWKWSSESRYPGAFPPVLENFRRAFFAPLPLSAFSLACGHFRLWHVSLNGLRQKRDCSQSRPLAANWNFFLLQWIQLTKWTNCLNFFDL